MPDPIPTTRPSLPPDWDPDPQIPTIPFKPPPVPQLPNWRELARTGLALVAWVGAGLLLFLGLLRLG